MRDVAESVNRKTLMPVLSRVGGIAALRQTLALPALLFWLGPVLAQGGATPAATPVPAGLASPANPIEGQVKAAYLFKFAGFVEWPDGSFERSDSPLVIGIAGNDGLADQLVQMVAGRNVGGHPLAVRRIRRGEAPTGVHVLFIGAAERAAASELLAGVRGHAILTVSDAPDALALGCMIAFIVAGERLRFDVGMAAVGSARLRISARMLAAAHRVQGVT